MNNFKINLDKWKFHYGQLKRWERYNHVVCTATDKTGGALGAREIWMNENTWIDVTIPHDWCCSRPHVKSAGSPNGYKERGEGWYYTTFTLPESAKDGETLLVFDGVANQCELYVNGALAKRNFSGYVRFTCDVSDYIQDGENIVALHVSSELCEGFWYEGAGIYRPAAVVVKDKKSFEFDSLFAKTLDCKTHWEVPVRYKLKGQIDEYKDCFVSAKITDCDGNVVAKADHQSVNCEVVLHVDKCDAYPKLWSPELPQLYNLELRLQKNDEILDSDSVRIGFRTIEWIADKGMYLNGKRYEVKGICCHQDHGGAGVAVTKSIMRFRIRKLKEMGCNAYRCVHHNPSGELLDICDEEGMLVLSENRHFRSSDEVLSQVRAMVKNCRNHPSVFMYSLFNEEIWLATEQGKRITQKIKDTVYSEDDSRMVTAAMDCGMPRGKMASDVLDVLGVNYHIDDYVGYHQAYPQKIVCGVENGPIYATRGIYKTDIAAQVYDNTGNEYADFGQSIEDTLAVSRAYPWVAGVFFWCGFDHRGEPEPYEWPSKSSHWGLTDLCGFEKDIFYLLQSFYSEKPMIHIQPHWNHHDGETVRVIVFTNCDKVRLMLNGHCVGEKNAVKNRAEFSVQYERGILIAEGECNGITVSDKVTTSDDAEKICCEVIEDTMVNVWVEDEQNNIVPNAENIIKLEVEGAELIGAANGDPNYCENGDNTVIPLFAGKCQFIIRRTGEESVKIHLISEGLKENSTVLK